MDSRAGLTPPWEVLRDRLEEAAAAMERAGSHEHAEAIRRIVAEWQRDQDEWNRRVGEVLGAHHDINNALVGVRGNAQLMQRNPSGQVPGIRERLEVVLRESGRIQEASARLGDLKAVLVRPVGRPHAA